MYSGFNPNAVDPESLLESAEEVREFTELDEELREEQAEKEEFLSAEAEQAKAEIEDPRNREGFGGIRGISKELGAAIGGGLQDTASSLVTLPERAIDMFSGEMVEEQKTEEGYKPEWDDFFVDDADPIETKTWWGGALRGLVHFGSMVPASVVALKAAGLSGLVAATGAGGTLLRGAAIGATSDLMSKYSQEDNALGMVRDRFGFIDTPLSTKDTDHPAMKTFKNVVEGMGIGSLFDAASIVIGKGIRKVKPKKPNKNVIPESNQLPSGEVTDGVADELGKAQLRAQSLRDQNIEMARDQAKGPEFGAYKNRKLANKWQGATTSTDTPYNVDQSLKRINYEYGAEMGSTGSLYTPAGLARIQVNANMAEKDLIKVMNQYMSDARVKEAVAEAKSKNKPLYELWGDATALAQKIYEGRNTSDLTASEFWSPLDKNSRLFGVNFIDSNQVKASELVIGSLLKEIRDSGITNRELYNIADLKDIDGPAKAMYDKIIAGVIHVNTSKKLQSYSFAGLQNRGLKKPTRAQIKAEIQADAEQSIKAHQLAMQMAGEGDDDLFKAYMEAVSMGGDIHNLTDFDNYIRKQFLGGTVKGQKKTGLIVKGMQRVMVNSVLSGPKTPMRALLGTGTATFLRPLSMALGASLKGDGATLRASMSAFNAMRESIPEAWTLFTKNLNSYWSGDVSTIKSRFNNITKGDEQWAMYTDWVNNSGRATNGDKLAFHLANGARALNDNKFLTYSTKIMAATDDAFGLLLARAKAKERAMREAMDLFNQGKVTEISPQMLKEAQDRFYSEIMDVNGNIIDDATLYSKKEATLTSDLHGFAQKLDQTFQSTPWAKPFLLFARTGMNGLELTAKHSPIFNRAVKEVREILKATPEDLSSVLQYGITNADELANAKALVQGRQAIGSSLILLANIHYLNGGLTGNGPADRKKRQTWIDAGWRPRSIKIGDVWIGYDAFEPFNLILSTIGDIGDYSEQMGPEWSEKQFRKLATVMMQGLTSKSYLASMQQFVDLFAVGQEGQIEKILASLANNSIPLSSLRNELGKLFNPHMKEINSGILQSWRNRNLFLEGISPEPVPDKFDMLTGKPIRDWDFPTRMFNAISPFSVNLDYSPGRKLLFDSGFDLRTTVYSYKGISFKNNPRIRSIFQKAIGEQNIQYQLDLLAKDPKILNSIQQMNFDRNNGLRSNDPMKYYYHNLVIADIFKKAKKKAWSKIQNDPEVLQLIQEDKDMKIRGLATLDKTREFKSEKTQKILNLRNK